MITVQATGTSELIAKTRALPDVFRNTLYARLLVQADMLVSYIKKDELSGQLLNVKTGDLRDSIAQKNIQNDSSGVAFQVSTTGNLPYAKPLNDGCGPYVIEATNAKALMFEIGGVTIFAKKVHHPGQKPRQFMQLGLEHQKPEIIAAIQGSMKGAWGA